MEELSGVAAVYQSVAQRHSSAISGAPCMVPQLLQKIQFAIRTHSKKNFEFVNF